MGINNPTVSPGLNAQLFKYFAPKYSYLTCYVKQPIFITVGRLTPRNASRLKETEPERAIELYRRATDLYQGDYLLDCPYSDWATEERERLLALYLSATEDLASLLLEQGDSNETITLCHHILNYDPLWEKAYRLLMVGHWQQGNRSVALRTYQRCACRLKETLGVEPNTETNNLYQKILNSDFSL